jgi:protein ImuB
MTRLLALVWPTLRTGGADDAAERFAAALDALDDLSPRIQAVANGVVLLDITGLAAREGTEPQVAIRAVNLTRPLLPGPLRAGIGDNRWQSLLAARLATPRAERAAGLRVIPPGEGRHILAGLPLDLLPTEAAIRDRFALFGLRTMGQLADLPRTAVGAQFGAEGERSQALARGEDPRPLAPRRRPERLVRRITFETPIPDLGGVTLVLVRAATDLLDQLRTRDLAPGRVTLRLARERATPLEVTLSLPEPSTQPEWIARLLLARLEADVRGTAADEEEEPPISGLRLVMDRLGNPTRRQLSVFEPQAGRWEELRRALERITVRFGSDRLWQAHIERPNAIRSGDQFGLGDIGP